jgi:double-strand break repair protein MRE11
LIRKGKTQVALYGLGNIRDERLNRMWTKEKVKFLRPSEEEGRDGFFNILVLHQNRVCPKSAIKKNKLSSCQVTEIFLIEGRGSGKEERHL